jgi:hypothetical protein
LRAGWNALILAVDRAEAGDDRVFLKLGSAQPVQLQAAPPK